MVDTSVSLKGVFARRWVVLGLLVILLLGLLAIPRDPAVVSASHYSRPESAPTARIDRSNLRAIFALSESLSKGTASVVGSGITITGGVHSNGGLELYGGGTGLSVQGPITYNPNGDVAISPSVSYSDPPYTIAPQPDPLAYNIADYQPGGSKAVAAGAHYYYFAGDVTEDDLIEPDGTFRDGLIYVAGNVQIQAFESVQTDYVTIVVTGHIRISGGLWFSAYTDDLLFFANGSDTAAGTITYAGSLSYIVGDWYAPHGLITTSGSKDTTLEGCVVGYEIDFSGSDNQVICQTDADVTTTDDSGPGSLRQAILDANANPGTDTITFNIPGAGPHTIAPLTALPEITDPVIIDGTTQPGASCDPGRRR